MPLRGASNIESKRKPKIDLETIIPNVDRHRVRDRVVIVIVGESLVSQLDDLVMASAKLLRKDIT